jgi:hypothetical protein
MSTETIVNRTDDPGAGDDFATRTKTSGARTQGMHLDPEVQGDILSFYSTAGALEESAADVATGAARLFRVHVVLNTAIGPHFLQVFNALTITGTPIDRAVIPAGGQVTLDYGVWGREMTTGISVALSSTLATYTSPTSVNAVFTVTYS